MKVAAVIARMGLTLRLRSGQEKKEVVGLRMPGLEKIKLLLNKKLCELLVFIHRRVAEGAKK